MSPLLISLIISAYFLFLIIVSYFTSRKADTITFFTANRQSPWYLVAFGMIGASLSGVTFISVPGDVGNAYNENGDVAQFAYFQVVLGYLLGYFVVAKVLLPIYYKLDLITIYTYLEDRFGKWSYKTGSFFFLLSRTVGAAFRLFLVAMVLQVAIFRAWGVSLSRGPDGQFRPDQPRRQSGRSGGCGRRRGANDRRGITLANRKIDF